MRQLARTVAISAGLLKALRRMTVLKGRHQMLIRHLGLEPSGCGRGVAHRMQTVVAEELSVMTSGLRSYLVTYLSLLLVADDCLSDANWQAGFEKLDADYQRTAAAAVKHSTEHSAEAAGADPPSLSS